MRTATGLAMLAGIVILSPQLKKADTAKQPDKQPQSTVQLNCPNGDKVETIKANRDWGLPARTEVFCRRANNNTYANLFFNKPIKVLISKSGHSATIQFGLN